MCVQTISSFDGSRKTKWGEVVSRFPDKMPFFMFASYYKVGRVGRLVEFAKPFCISLKPKQEVHERVGGCCPGSCEREVERHWTVRSKGEK